MSAPSAEQIQKAVDRLRTELAAQLDMMKQPDLLVSDVDTVLNALAHLTEEREGLRKENALLRAALDRQPYPNEYDDMEQRLAALTEVHERLRALSAKWRADANAFSTGHELALGRVRSSQLRACADELDVAHPLTIKNCPRCGGTHFGSVACP